MTPPPRRPNHFSRRSTYRKRPWSKQQGSKDPLCNSVWRRPPGLLQSVTRAIGVMDGVPLVPTCTRRQALPSRSRSSLASSLTWRRYHAALSGWPSVQACSAICTPSAPRACSISRWASCLPAPWCCSSCSQTACHPTKAHRLHSFRTDPASEPDTVILVRAGQARQPTAGARGGQRAEALAIVKQPSRKQYELADGGRDAAGGMSAQG